MELAPEDRARMDVVVQRLTDEFAGYFSHETVRRLVEESVAMWPQVRITTYLPVLLHRFVRHRLRACGQVEGLIEKQRPEILLVCVHNAGRSQMAAALLTKHAGDRVSVRSAGTMPAEGINPLVLEAMREVGVDLSGAYPKPLTDEVVRAADVVVTMGCGDACPVYPGKRYLDWDLEDPADLDPEGVRRVRDDIDLRVRGLLDELAVPARQPSRA